MEAATEQEGPRVAVVMPAYQGARWLPTSLPAALRAAGDGEVVVVDAGSTDDTGAVAESLGARVVRLPRRAGPAEARNAGAEVVDADVVLFVDCDCVAKPDVVERVRRHFAEDPELVSLTGSYDDAPPETNFASRYMNLRHHHVHQEARREGATFWAGCGAVRRDAFRAVGGFDAGRYPLPMIEDIELGVRLRGKGRARLDPDLQVTHLKRWTLGSVIGTDVARRALPWSELILDTGLMPDDLNLRLSARVAAAWAPLSLAAVVVLPWAALRGGATTTLVCVVAIAVSLAFHVGMLRTFARGGGPLFAVGGWLFHQVHLIYSAATFAYSVLRHRLRGPREARAK